MEVTKLKKILRVLYVIGFIIILLPIILSGNNLSSLFYKINGFFAALMLFGIVILEKKIKRNE